jgi:hypothetical protein
MRTAELVYQKLNNIDPAVSLSLPPPLSSLLIPPQERSAKLALDARNTEATPSASGGGGCC